MEQVFSYIIGLGAAVMMPILFTILGVCIGGDRATAYEVAKEQLLRPLAASGESPDPALRKLERALLKDANSLGIGPMGLGGKTTLLGVRVASRPRVPASFFVTIAYMCWACRRRVLGGLGG